MALRSFLLIEVGCVFVKARATNKETSVFTVGFLLFKASRTSSNIASKLVCLKCNVE